MPRKAKSNTAVVVNRGSQSHHTPQVGLAQIAPWQQRRKASSTPTSIEPSIRASHFQPPVKRKSAANTRAQVMASMSLHADGTWTYMIRCTFPMNCSGGAKKMPKDDQAITEPTPRKSK